MRRSAQRRGFAQLGPEDLSLPPTQPIDVAALMAQNVDSPPDSPAAG